MKKFIVCTSSATGAPSGANVIQRNIITAYLKRKEWPVWHWFENIWLTVDESGEGTPSGLRDELRRLIGQGTFILVMEVEPTAFSGFGSKDGWPWMMQHWGKSE
ncbi:MAG TPA: hypothetical protein VME43_30430 [Bryobacteraceae bacterium]|nr:hypothetical protein [Bryobacteraceae bacterium]